MSTTAPRRKLPWLLQAPQVRDFGAPQWFERLPVWVSTGGVLLILVAISAVLRTRYISGQFWSDEAVAVGVASHPLGAIPGILRQQGSAPLYYLLLHVWINLFGSSESATHALSLAFGLLSIPIAMWAGWSLGGRRAGMYAAILFTFCAFLTEYAQETQAYELLALLGLIAIASYLHALIYRRRVYLIPLAITLALMLYTSFWAIFFWAGAALALIPIYITTDDRRRVLIRRRDRVRRRVAPVHPVDPEPDLSDVGHAPVRGALPTSSARPSRATCSAATAWWSRWRSPAPSGSCRCSPRSRRTRQATAVWALVRSRSRRCSGSARVADRRHLGDALLRPAGSPVAPAGRPDIARAGILGLIVIALSIAFVVNLASFCPSTRATCAMSPTSSPRTCGPGTWSWWAMPEQSPLAWYYLPAGLRFTTITGADQGPQLHELGQRVLRLKDSNPQTMETALVSSLKPGQRLLYARPLTEGAKFWKASWSQLVRRRAAQWGALLSADRQLRPIAGAVAPENYSGSCCVADSAIVYTKVG